VSFAPCHYAPWNLFLTTVIGVPIGTKNFSRDAMVGAPFGC